MIFRYRNKSVRYDIAGSGPPVLLVHGFLESLHMWDPLMSSLIDRYTVIRPDLPGHGESAIYGDIHTMEFMVELLAALLEYLEIRKVNVMGHSMGGYVALALIERFQEKINNIILLNSTTEADSEDRLVNRKRALDLVEKNPGLFIKTSIPNLFSPSNRDRLKHRIESYQDIALKMHPSGIQAAIRGMMARPDRTSVLKEFTGGKLWICGEDDPLLPVFQCIKMSSETETTLFSVEGGHMLVEENLPEIVKIVHFIE